MKYLGPRATLLVSLLGLGCRHGSPIQATTSDAADPVSVDVRPDASVADLRTSAPDLAPGSDGPSAADLAATDGPAAVADGPVAVADGPAPITGPSPARAVAAGWRNTCVVFENGQLKCWGDNSHGQLGLGDRQARGARPEDMGANLPAIDLGAGRTVREVAVGADHICALLDVGRVKCWGDDSLGQLGVIGRTQEIGAAAGEMGDDLPYVDLGESRRVLAIAAGPQFNCAVLEGGQVKCWGHNLSGNLGQGDGVNRRAGGLGDSLPPIALGTGRTALAVSVGGAFRVGNPGGSGPFTGLALACALLDDGEIKCWGGGRVNHYGALGDNTGTLDRGSRPGEMGDKLPAVALGGHAARAVATGCSYACALIDNGQVRCWGNPHMGKMGAGDLFGPPADPYAPVALSRPAVALTASAVTTDMDFAHSCALLDNGAVACWGNNGNGQLGLGDTVTRGDAQVMGRPVPLAAVDLGAGRKARAVVAGATHTCALLDRGEVKCWGSNVGGLLGLGDTQNRGNAQGQMGDKLPAVTLW